MKKFIFWALASHGEGISGGDRIYIEFARRWSRQYKTKVITWEEGVLMMARNNLTPKDNLTFKSIKIPNSLRSNFLLCYLSRIAIGIVNSLVLKIPDSQHSYLYTASEFWMDSLPGAILKLRYPMLKWVATWYQTAPSPVRGFSEVKRSRVYRLNALFLWLSQLLIHPLITHYADFVLVNNELEKQVFPGRKVIVVLGAVDIQQIDSYRQKLSFIREKYTAVFQGRFHPQKGVVELIDIWKKVVEKIPYAKLAMIGDGPLMEKVKLQIANYKLQNHIKLFGYLFDGPSKYKVFAQSQIVVHPAFFDSGGMASAEAMAFDIPLIAFNLPAYNSYYPKGVIKVSTGNLDAFANTIVDLSNHASKRHRIGKQAGQFIHECYSWENRARQVLSQLIS